jgi:hypothetical protein
MRTSCIRLKPEIAQHRKVQHLWFALGLTTVDNLVIRQLLKAGNCPKVLTASRELWMKNATFQNCSSPQVAAAHIVTQRVVVEGAQ